MVEECENANEITREVAIIEYAAVKCTHSHKTHKRTNITRAIANIAFEAATHPSPQIAFPRSCALVKTCSASRSSPNDVRIKPLSRKVEGKNSLLEPKLLSIPPCTMLTNSYAASNCPNFQCEDACACQKQPVFEKQYAIRILNAASP